MKTNGFLIAKGNIIVSLAAAASFFLFFICATLGVLGVISTLFLAYIFRNDSRHIFKNADNILSPVDGKVIAIDTAGDQHKVYCEIGLLDSHKILSPISGKLLIKDHQKGLNLDPNSFKGSLLNEQVVFDIFNEELSKNIKIRLISGKCASSIDFTEKEDIEQGETMATLIKGIAVISLDKNSYKLDIKLGDELKAGQTTLTL